MRQAVILDGTLNKFRAKKGEVHWADQQQRVSYNMPWEIMIRPQKCWHIVQLRQLIPRTSSQDDLNWSWGDRCTKPTPDRHAKPGRHKYCRIWARDNTRQNKPYLWVATGSTSVSSSSASCQRVERRSSQTSIEYSGETLPVMLSNFQCHFPTTGFLLT